jgi:hypothetical protein
MSEYQYIRHGRYIDINIEEIGKSQWTWWYTIDGEYFTELRDAPRASEDEAQLEAESDANQRADQMPRGDA